MKKKKKTYLILTLLLIVTGLVIATATGALPRAVGRALVVKSPLEKADLIYVYGGSPVERPAHAAVLYKEGYAPRVACGGILVNESLLAIDRHFNEGSLARHVLVQRGVPEKSIVQIWEGTSTYDETEALRDFVIEHHLKKVILVSSPFHMRRVRWTARKVFRGTDVEFIYAPVPEELSRTSIDHWWKEEYDLITVAVEYMKQAYYVVKYR